MSRKLLIKLLFWLLKVDAKTKDLMIFEDMDKFTDYDKTTLDQVRSGILQKYMIAKARVYNESSFIQYLYFLLVQKQREHMLTHDKKKLAAQEATVLFILLMIQELKEADEAYMELKKRKQVSALKMKKKKKTEQQTHVEKAYENHEAQLQKEKAQFEHLNNKK